MAITDLFRKKDPVNPELTLTPDPTPEPLKVEIPAQPIVDTPKTEPVVEKPLTPEEKEQAMKAEFDKWWATLTPAQQKNMTKKMEKMYLRGGTAIVCNRCKMPGGKINGKGYTLRRDLSGEGYVHAGDCPSKGK